MLYLVHTYLCNQITITYTTHQDIYTGIPQLTRFLWQPKISVKWNSRYVNHSIAEKNFIKNSHNADILYYKTALCKSFCTSPKIRVKWNRATRNRVSRGIPYLKKFKVYIRKVCRDILSLFVHPNRDFLIKFIIIL